MASEITTPHVPAGTPTDGLPVEGVLSGHLVGRDVDGKSMVELVLPGRFPGGEAVPFEASWWSVEPGHETDPDRHAVKEVWFVASGLGSMRLGAAELEIRAGQAIFIPTNTSHHVRAHGQEDLVVFSVWWT